MTEDPDGLLASARRVQDVRAGRVSGYLTLPVRSEVDVAFGRLMAQLDDSEETLKWGPEQPSAYLHVLMVETAKIFAAKQRYDAARLSKGGTP